MANLNKVMLMGNLTANPELRYTPKGTAVTDLRLAINRYYSGENSERQEETTFVDVTLWNRQAEIANQYLTKGSGVFIEGRLQLDTWEDKASGQKRNKLRVIGESLQLLPRAGAPTGVPYNDGNNQQARPNYNNGGNFNQPRQQSYNPPPSAPQNGGFIDADDDIPF